MKYTIKVSAGDRSYTLTRKRADAAELLLLRTVREEIEAHGGLDTAWGRRTYRAAQTLDVTRGGSLTIHPDHGPVIFVTRSTLLTKKERV